MATILLVEDDFALAMGTEYALQAEGYRVIHAANLAEARRITGIEDVKLTSGEGVEQAMKNDAEKYACGEVSMGKNNPEKTEAQNIDAEGKEAEEKESEMPDLVLLDVMLPDGNGYEFCKELRKADKQIPIIFLTAVSEEVNIVQGLELGADDYVAKPYRVKELLSRITANLRRADMLKDLQSRMQILSKEQEQGEQRTYGAEVYGSDSYGKESVRTKSTERTRYCFGIHQLDIQEFRLYANETMVDVTPGEFRLLKELVQNDGIVLTRNQLLERLYDTGESFVDDNTLSVYMKRLRDKLGEDAVWIETVRGVGYRFRKKE